MSEQPTITVKIDPLGRSTVEANNFTGTGCEAATQGIEKALAGGKANVSKVIKPEWHEAEQAGQEVHQKSW